jgi:hypothetical protein
VKVAYVSAAVAQFGFDDWPCLFFNQRSLSLAGTFKYHLEASHLRN